MLKKRSRPGTSHLENIVIALYYNKPEIFNRDGFSNDFQFYENMRKQIYRFDDNESSFTISQQDLQIVIRKVQILQNEKQQNYEEVSETRYLPNNTLGDNHAFNFGLEDQNSLTNSTDNKSDPSVPQQSPKHEQKQGEKAEIKQLQEFENPQVVIKQANEQNSQGNQVNQSGNASLAQNNQNDPQIVQPDQGQNSPNNQNLNNQTQREMNTLVTHDTSQQVANEINPTNDLSPTNTASLNFPNQNETESEQNVLLAQNNMQVPNAQELNQNVQEAEQYFMPVIQQLSWEQRTIIKSINNELRSFKSGRKEKEAQIDKNFTKMTSFFNVVKRKQIKIQQRLKQLEQTMIPIGNILCRLKVDSDQRLQLVNFCLKGHKNNDVVIQKFQTYKKINSLTGLQPKDRQFKYGLLYDRYVFF